MNPAQYREARALFHRLADRPDDEQRRTLDDADLETTVAECVRRMLDLDPASDDVFAEDRLGDYGRSLLTEEAWLGAPLERVGRFRVLERLGEGGMGVVFRALDETATDEQPVAVKVLHAGLASTGLVRRFRREAEVLSRLAHPGIARFLDAGVATAVTEDGTARPVHFLAMEYVPGDTILRHASYNGLDQRARLELMARVCDAVYAAHEAGIVHRDLKPGNVLVAPVDDDPVGMPKVLDFGVARHTGEDVETLTLTRTGAVLGTVPYMSPEQVSGGELAVTGASDIYGLGVLTYELLTGELPYPVRGLPLPEAARVVSELPPRRTGRRGDLDTVLGKALEKDPDDRYSSAAALAADLRRLAAGRPVLARPPSWATRSVRIVRRNRALAASVAGVVLALLVGVVVATSAAFREADLRADADASAAEARLAADVSARTAHIARLQNAAASLAAHDLPHARAVLDTCEPERRGWPWHLLRARLDDSIVRTWVPGVTKSSSAQLLPGRTPEEVFLVAVSQEEPRTASLFRWDVRSGAVELAWSRDGAQGTAFHVPTGTLTWIGLDGTWTREVLATGEVLASASMGDVDTKPLLTVPVHSADGVRVRFHGDVDLLLEWDGVEGSAPVVTRFPGQVVTDDAYRWVAWQRGRKILLRDELSGEERSWWEDGRPKSVQPDGTVVVHLTGTGRVALCRFPPDGAPLPDGAPVERRVVQLERGESIGDVVFHPTGDLVATLGGHRSTRVWSTTTGELLHAVHGGSIPQRAGLLLEDDRLVTLDDEGTLRAWDLRAPPGRLVTHGDTVTGLALAGDRVVFCTHDKKLGSVDLRTRELHALAPSPVDAWTLSRVAVSPDGRRLAVSCLRGPPHGRSAYVVDLATGETTELEERGMPWDGNIDFAWSPDGTRLALQDEYHGIDLFAWDADGGGPELVATSPLSGKGVRGAVAFSPDGRWLAARVGTQHAGLLDPETLEVVRRFPGERAILTVIAWSPDGTRLAGGFRDAVARIWSVEDRTILQRLQGHDRTVIGLAWSPDGALLATGSMDRSVRLWDTEHGDEVLRLADVRSEFRELTFARDGECLVGETRTGLWIWDSADAVDRPPVRDPPPPSRDVRDLVAPGG